jgi:predicted O-methyltransferase YrrM
MILQCAKDRKFSPGDTSMRKIPWLTESAIDKIDKFILSCCNPKILEFGMGSSTIYYSNICNELISVEHDKNWFDSISEAISLRGNEKKCKLILSQSALIAENSDHLVLSYENICDEYADEYFDLIIIDGRDRVKCFFKAEPKLKSGGMLVLDNSERSEYSMIFDAYRNKEKFDYVQTKPDREGFFYKGWTTTCFIK